MSRRVSTPESIREAAVRNVGRLFADLAKALMANCRLLGRVGSVTIESETPLGKLCFSATASSWPKPRLYPHAVRSVMFNGPIGDCHFSMVDVPIWHGVEADRRALSEAAESIVSQTEGYPEVLIWLSEEGCL